MTTDPKLKEVIQGAAEPTELRDKMRAANTPYPQKNDVVVPLCLAKDAQGNLDSSKVVAFAMDFDGEGAIIVTDAFKLNSEYTNTLYAEDYSALGPQKLQAVCEDVLNDYKTISADLGGAYEIKANDLSRAYEGTTFSMEDLTSLKENLRLLIEETGSGAANNLSDAERDKLVIDIDRAQVTLKEAGTLENKDLIKQNMISTFAAYEGSPVITETLLNETLGRFETAEQALGDIAAPENPVVQRGLGGN